MKIRIQNNSIRLRLSQVEIQQLAQQQQVKGEVPFPDGKTWSYVLVAQEQSALFSALLLDAGIQINISKEASKSLNETDAIGHEGELTTPNAALKILVEKDFKCLTPRAEDESGLYENPLKAC